MVSFKTAKQFNVFVRNLLKYAPKHVPTISEAKDL